MEYVIQSGYITLEKLGMTKEEWDTVLERLRKELSTGKGVRE